MDIAGPTEAPYEANMASISLVAVEVMFENVDGNRSYLTLIHWHNSHLDDVTKIPWTKFRSSYPGWLHMKIGFNRETCLEIWTGGRISVSCKKVK